MKSFIKTGLVFLMLAMAVNVFAQRPVWDVTMTNELPSGSLGYITKTITDKENSSYTAYHYKSTANLNELQVNGGDTNALIYKLNEDGKHQWQINFAGDEVKLVDMDLDDDLNLYALILNKGSAIKAYTSVTSTQEIINGAGLHLVKILPNGTLSWNKPIANAINNHMLINMAIDADNNINVFVGYKDSVSITDSSLYYTGGNIAIGVFKLSVSGDVLLCNNIVTTPYPEPYTFGIQRVGLNKAKNNVYLLISNFSRNSYLEETKITSFNSPDIIVELNTNLRVEHYIDLKPQKPDAAFLSCAPLPNGDYVVGGYTQGTGTVYVIDQAINSPEYTRPFFARVSSTGTLVWLKSYQVDQALLTHVEEVILSPDENYIYVQFFLSRGSRIFLDGHIIGNIQNTPILAKYDLNGNYIWHLSSKNGASTYYRQTLAVDSAGAVYFSEEKNGDFRFVCYEHPTWVREEVLFKITEEDHLIGDFAICKGGEKTVCTTKQGQAVYWSTGEQTPTITIKDTGIYTVQLNYNSCVYRDTFEVSYHEKVIDVSIGADTTICPDEELELAAQTTAKEYLWNTGDTTETIDVNQAGEYNVRVNEDGCFGYDTLEVTVKNISVLTDIGKDTFICEGTTAQLYAQSKASRYLWSTNDENPSITVNKGGEYSVIADSMGCKGYDTIYVSTVPYPAPYLGQDTTICFEGGSMMLNAGLGDAYLWNTGEATPSILIIKDGTYTVTVTNNGACSSTDELVISNGCISTLFTPTAFNPHSSDPDNAVFKPIGNGIIIIKLSIYNRWGEMIYYEEGPDAQWDGTYKGTPVMQGSYMYVITYKAKGAEQGTYEIGTESGYLTLLR